MNVHSFYRILSGGMIKTMKLKMRILCWLIATMMATNVAASDYQGHDSIMETARQFMLDHIVSVYHQQPEIVTGMLDSRLRLRKCSIPLQAFQPDGSRDLGKITVGVKCTDSKPWSLHVPVTIRIYKQVVVAARTLPRGAVLTKNDVKLASYDLADLTRGYFEDPARNLGMKLRRRLLAGEPLTQMMMEKIRTVKRGQRVIILASTGGMEVRTSGKALSHGSVGERIRVVNLSSKQKLEGVVTESGEILVDM